MDIKKITTLASLSFIVAGCSSFHSQEYKNIKADFHDSEKDMEKYKKNNVAKIIAGATINDFYVDNTPVKIKIQDRLNLPSTYPNTISVYSALPITEKELAARLLEDYKIKIKINRLIILDSDDKAEKKESGGKNTGAKDPIADSPIGTVSDTAKEDENGGQGEDPNDPLFGGPSTANLNDIRPIDYTGSISGFMDLIASDRKLDWKYDEDSNEFIFYDMDTVTFDIIDNSGTSTREINVKSSLDGTGDGLSSNSNQTSSTSSTFNNWETVENLISGMKSKYGSFTADQKHGRVTVTDTKDVINRMKKVIDSANDVSDTQIVLDVTFLKFTVNKKSSFGLDLTTTSASDIVKNVLTGGVKSKYSDSAASSIYSMEFSKAGIGANLSSLGEYGVVNYKFNDQIVSMNDEMTPYQKSVDETIITKIKIPEDDDDDKKDSGSPSGKSSSSAGDDKDKAKAEPETSIHKTGLTSNWISRVIGDRVKVNGQISLVSNQKMIVREDLSGLTLPTDDSLSLVVNTIIDNGKTKVASVKEIIEDKASAKGAGGENSIITGGGETTEKQREISVVLVTPYILK
ncbi:hypothetical protein [Photobacterium kishitanii]|uniref:Secretin N-terminal domain-containing protein n=1 Tax=Photobacterium kishitanii TaxID=318456 RepID=A0A2T3KMZ7_9GAMM|nr:hypothetical protein [Photobacterium kishitanii]PSV01187.1 hypothetical protein C9J27_03955 [Photobacterium kishitanii]